MDYRSFALENNMVDDDTSREDALAALAKACDVEYKQMLSKSDGIGAIVHVTKRMIAAKACGATDEEILSMCDDKFAEIFNKIEQRIEVLKASNTRYDVDIRLRAVVIKDIGFYEMLQSFRSSLKKGILNNIEDGSIDDDRLAMSSDIAQTKYNKMVEAIEKIDCDCGDEIKTYNIIIDIASEAGAVDKFVLILMTMLFLKNLYGVDVDITEIVDEISGKAYEVDKYLNEDSVRFLDDILRDL